MTAVTPSIGDLVPSLPTPLLFRALLAVVLTAAPLVGGLGISGASPASPVAAVVQARASSTPGAAVENVVLRVESNRPDLVSGGDVRVSVKAQPDIRRTALTLRLNGRDVSHRFAVRPGKRFEALLTGLRDGENVLTARAPGFAGRLVITNHPIGGSVFSGPQTAHYRCQETALDAQCNEAPVGDFLYRSTDPREQGVLKPYDPQNPPDDVSTTTTQTGETIPFIVLRDQGYMDRDRYTILTLWQPDRPWSRWEPQPQFNHKLLVTHGGGCGASYSPGGTPLEDYSGTIPADFPGVAPSYVTALGRGFSVVSTALANTGHNCNVAMNAESVMMAKERFVEQYGTVRYTIGTGCSGGSIAQHTVANAYPGIYQGLITTCSYPDTFTAGAQFADYHLLRLYFEDPSRWAPGVVWSPTQFAAVEGHLSHVNAVVADEGLFKAALNPEHECGGTVDPVAGDPSTRYDAETNPGGVRCSVLDLLINPLGPRPESAWGPQEQAVGRGFGGIPFGNAGLLYGLEALRSGQISTAQFVDLNVKVGGLDVDSVRTDARTAGDPESIANAYRTGLVNEATNLSGVAIINHGGPDPGIAHDYAHAFWTEDRMTRYQGDADNRVMWFGATPLIGDPRWATEALTAMDRWLHRVELDRSGDPLADKIVAGRPDDVHDRCSNLPGFTEMPDETGAVQCLLPESVQTRLSTPREVAGGDRLNDVLSCSLKPIERDAVDVGLVPLTDAQWAELATVFPDGICDFSVPGIGQGPAETWLEYADDDGDVVHGGRNLPDVAPGQGIGLMARAFRPLLRE